MTTIDAKAVAQTVAKIAEDYAECITSVRECYDEAKDVLHDLCSSIEDEKNERALLERTLEAFIDSGADPAEVEAAKSTLAEMREDDMELPEDASNDFWEKIRQARNNLADAEFLEDKLSGVDVALCELNHGTDCWTLKALVDLLERQHELVIGNL